MNRRAEKLVEQNVAVVPIRLVLARHGVRQHEFACEPGMRGCGGAQAGVVRLACTGGYERIAALLERVADEELQLPELAAAPAEAHQIVALDVDAGTLRQAESPFETSEALDRCRPVKEPVSRPLLQ